MRTSSAFTLIEVVIVIALIGIISIPAFTNYFGARSNQALQASAEGMADILKRAHIFSRENRDFKTWGVSYVNPNKYALVSYTTNPSLPTTEATFDLDSEVTCANFGTLWFEVSTGFLHPATTLLLTNSHGTQYSINILETGTIEVKPI